jgi:hypothetical protein
VTPETNLADEKQREGFAYALIETVFVNQAVKAEPEPKTRRSRFDWR